jgi:hypothetical protein
MPKLGKYDLVISFASEDDTLALEINRWCRKRCLHTYYYKRENNSGSQIDKLTQVIFNEKANNALVLLSHHYQSKTLTQKELQWLKKAQRAGRLNKIFYIPINQELAASYTGNTIYINKSDPKHMAKQIREVINRDYPMPVCWLRFFPWVMVMILLAIWFIHRTA